MNLRPGEIVEVLHEREILATLDEEGTVEKLPFMRTMRAYCGKSFRVLRRADKMIVEGFGVRCMRNTVILDKVRCDGDAQEGCQRACMILWKEMWLKRAGTAARANKVAREASGLGKSDAKRESHHSVLVCQSSGLMDASFHIPGWDVRRFMWNITSGVYRPSESVGALFFSLSSIANNFLNRPGQRLFGVLRRTPEVSLNLKPGEVVRIKCKEAILRTLDQKGRNRGLEFTAEMEKYCGQTFRVLKRVNRMLSEATGKMRQIHNTVLLEHVVCDGKAHGGCPRNCYCLLREIWLERVE